jgi:hypothetical protein
MPDLMIRCSETGKDTRTGIDTDLVSFEKFPDVLIYSSCEHCGLEHAWWRGDAWLADEEPHSQKPMVNERPVPTTFWQRNAS